MSNFATRRAAVLIAILSVTTLARITAGQQASAALDKPLARFTLGDLFPPVSDSLRDTAATWQRESENVERLASARLSNIRSAVPAAKAQVEQAKDEVKVAEKSRDQVAMGTAQGRVKSAESVKDVLERLESGGETQGDLARAWSKTAELMRMVVETDAAFDRYRGNGIARPEAGQPDRRLSPEGYQAFQNYSEAVKDLGDAFQQLGQKLTDLGSGRLKLASDLEKSGLVRVR
ncbi:MAG TPA: hypothetical protein VMS54_12765 [Vicinamibacterales bacterium]|nr:hypothetical protein [Vicinamibacterales bacterium]